jgi:deoxyribodipyrimidine photo-lyase
MGGLPRQCVWLKRDLRLRDHAAFWEAAGRGPVVAVYVIEPEVIDAPDFDAMHWDFIAASLRELAADLGNRAVPLRVERGNAVEVLGRLQQTEAFQEIWAHEETGCGHTFERDRAVARWARSAGVTVHELPQNGVVRALKDRDGWARQWAERMDAPARPVPSFAHQGAEDLGAAAPVAIPTAADLGLVAAAGRAVDLEGGESAGLRRLDSFIQTRGRRYHREMSSPNTAYESCSRLSPYLAWGCLSMRTVVQTVRAAAAGGVLPKVAARSFLSRCHWHCHFIQKLESEPAIETRAFNRACDDLRAEGSQPGHLEAWQAGRTGYPFIDACMRSLRARGWINFRMRAMLVSFASYHLWIDWRRFRDWLACQFIDYEPGIHISQIQMQSGLTGINTLRIYNPIKQGQDHDPAGVFIRRWVPELAKFSDTDIHTPWAVPEMIQMDYGCRVGTDYPMPIVDHTEAIRFARARFSELRQRDDYWAQSKRVLERHGSRKGGGGRPKRAKKADKAQTELSFDEARTKSH